MRALLALVILAGVLVAQGEPTYTDKGKGFTITIPKGWSVTSTGDPVACLLMNEGANAAANFNLRVQPAVAPLAEGKLSWDVFVPMVEQKAAEQVEGYKVLKHKGLEHQGHPAVMIWAQASVEDIAIKNLQYIVATKKHLHILTWTGQAADFPKYESVWIEASKAFKEL